MISHLLLTRRFRRGTPPQAFSVFELLVTLAILVVLVAIAIPVYSSIRQRAHKQVALDKIKKVGSALVTYASQNGGNLPAEDADGNDTWDNIAKPGAKDAWYNALPRLIGQKAAADYSNTPGEFYTDENILFLPGANYPDKKKVLAPLFAFAFNTKLERTDLTGARQRARLDQIAAPAKTVALLEQGLLNEDRTLEVQSRKDYDGSPKGSAKSFVGRYGGQGVLFFFDGHVELVHAKELLTETGQFPFPQTNVIWTANPEENPNKDAVTASLKKKAGK
ncbi:MAG TPA: type II secretion system protein [Chthoniobacteraceae bacterium]|jgi:prepilin-type processing-associated H-X9-DG protein|nr:type II secretion system protein [Chthoniobacteraceae bacterium]